MMMLRSSGAREKNEMCLWPLGVFARASASVFAILLLVWSCRVLPSARIPIDHFMFLSEILLTSKP